MQYIALEEAKTKLAELIEMVAIGEEIIITKNDGSTFKIIPALKTKPFPKFGSAKGLIEISDDFNDLLDDFKEYMP